MKRVYLYILLFFISFTTSNIQAQNITNKPTNSIETTADSIDLPKSMTYPLDSLLNDWKAKTYLDLGKDCSTANVGPTFSDSVYADRLSRIPAIMEMPYNDIVKRFIEQYTVKLRKQVSFMLSACNFYMPIFEEALDAYNIPLELRYLPIIESALNPSAISRAGAAGLWQFMLSTGKIYGLEANSLVDERRDPIKSSWAAARYLKELYAIYGDWNLVIAAYNCGPGNINKAVRRANGKTDYWQIYNFLPRETRGYVPAFIAANYVMNYYCEHNICPMETNIPINTDTVLINKQLHFKQISELCNISVEQLRSLNPQYRRDIIPGHIKPYPLRLPQENISQFIDQQDTIYTHRFNELFKNRKTVSVSSYYSTPSRGSGNLTYYKIRTGDTLGSIASRFGVRVKDIQRWNGLRSTKIWPGKRLKIYK